MKTKTPRSLPLAAGCLLAAAVIGSRGSAVEYLPGRAPEEPQVEAASEDAAAQIGTFRTPESLVCELFAAEPHVANPVVFTIDNRGRVFVCESFRQGVGVTDNRNYGDEWLMADLAAQTVADRIDYHRELLGAETADSFQKFDDRIRLLVDKDGDGKIDDAVVFADGFNDLEEGTGAGVLVRGNNAYYTNIPHLWKLTDEDGDGQSDSRKSLAYGFGVRVAFRGHDMHGLIVGPDGRLYFSIGDRGYYVKTPNGLLANPESGAVFRCELDGSNLEVFATGFRNPQELAFDNHGNLFTGDNNSDSGDKARWVYVVPGGDSGWRMTYQYLSDRGPFNREKIWHPYDPAVTPAYTVPPIANISDGPSGLTFDPGTALNEAFRDAFLLVDFRGQPSNSGIRLIRNEADGAFFKVAESTQPIWNMLATDADFGPDGALYVSDWVNGWTGLNKGRIYRFRDESGENAEIQAEVQKLLGEDFSKFEKLRLIGLLGHADRRVRLEAQLALAAAGEVEPLQSVARTADSQFARLHATWGLGQIARRTGYPEAIKETLLKLVSDKDGELAVAALNILGESRDESIGPTINEAIGSGNPRVAAAAAMAAGRLGLPDSVDVVSLMLAANDNRDPILRHAGIMAFAGQSDMNRIVALIEHDSPAVRLAAVVALRKRDDARVKYFLNDASPAVVLEAARAIHDNQLLRQHLPTLAELELKDEADPALVRRVLNANFRVGTADAAERIAALAARDSLSDAVRGEAVEMLLRWGTPGKTDLVINRYDPLPDRGSDAVAVAVEQYLPQLLKTEGKIYQNVLKLGATYGLAAMRDVFVELIDNASGDPETRVNALRGLLRLEDTDADDLLTRLISDADPQVRGAVLEGLVERRSSLAYDALIRAIAEGTIAEKQQAWDLVPLLEDDRQTQVMLRGLEAYRQDGLPKELRLNVFEAAQKSQDPRLVEAVAKIQIDRKDLRESDPVAFYADSEVGGAPADGMKLFLERTQLSCVRCHKVGSAGGEVGPNLTEIGKLRDSRYLLESIVAPNAQIPTGFKTVIVQTDEGNIYSGIVKAETDDELVLLDANGQEIRVEQDIILGQKEGLSSMPADLMKSMTPRELRDLVAFLKGLDGSFRGAGSEEHGDSRGEEHGE